MSTRHLLESSFYYQMKLIFKRGLSLTLFIVATAFSCSVIENEHTKLQPELIEFAKNEDLELLLDGEGNTVMVLSINEKPRCCRGCTKTSLTEGEYELFAQNLFLDFSPRIRTFNVNKVLICFLDWRDNSLQYAKEFLVDSNN